MTCFLLLLLRLISLLFHTTRFRMLIMTFLFMPFSSLDAQQYIIRGRVLSDASLPLPAVTITLFNATDTMQLSSSLTDTAGMFRFGGLAAGRFLLSASAAGYRQRNMLPVMVGADVQDTMIVIAMEPLLREMTEVKVTGKRPLVERRADRVIMNVGNLIQAAGASALELLGIAPGVRTVDDAITLNGRSGVAVYIDDKPLNMQGADLAGYLRSLPAGIIEKIEILSNPSSGYEASGNGGIINIRLKKFRAKGFSGNISSENIRGRRTRLSENVNLNFRTNRIQLYSNLSYYRGAGLATTKSTRYYDQGASRGLAFVDEVMIVNNPNHSVNIKTGMDLNLSPSLILTAGFMYYKWIVNETACVNSRQSYFTAADSVNSGSNTTAGMALNTRFNIGFRKVYDSLGKQWALEAVYIRYRSRQSILNTNEVADLRGLPGNNEEFTAAPDDIIPILSVKTDYVHPFGKRSGIVVGYKYNTVRTASTGMYHYRVNNDLLPVNVYRFAYRESVHALYANYTVELKRLEVQAGLRAEQTKSVPVSDGVRDVRFARSYINLFPAFFLVWKMDEAGRHRLNFAYGSRIERPGYANLNPALLMRGRFTYTSGNPYLKPAFAHNVEAGYSFGNDLTATFFYNRSTDEINEITNVKDDIAYRMPVNSGVTVLRGVSASGTVAIRKWWQVNINTLYHHAGLKTLIGTEHYTLSIHHFSATVTQQFGLGKGWSAELMTDYTSAGLLPQSKQRAVWFSQGGVAKKIWKDRAVVRLNIRDMFYTRADQVQYINIRGMTGFSSRKWDTRSITLAFSYTFSKGISTIQVKGTPDEEGKRLAE